MSTNAPSANANNSPTGDLSASLVDLSDASRPTTPPNTNSFLDDQRIYKDTPATHRATQEHSYQNGTLVEMRAAVVRDLDYGIPEIDTDLFISNLLPPLRDGIIVEDIVSSLRSEGIVTADGKLAKFQTEPRRHPQIEDKVFAPLAEICEKSASFALRTSQDLDQNFTLSLLPYVTPKSDRASTTRPDGYFILKDAEDLAQSATEKTDQARWWYDIALTAEFKKQLRPQDRNDNVSKVVFNMQQTMTLDPCRRFTFGITIENTSMRLWFASRGAAVVSKAFDFTREVNLLNRIFLSFAFASKEELGWDPTIRPTVIDGKRAYHIDVGEETYESEDVLSECSADALVSRASRVWKVRRLGSEDHFVLKDLWVEDGRDLEFNIYEWILSAIKEKYGTEIRDEAASHLLTPVTHWIVHINGKEDHTTKVMMRGYIPSLVHRFNLKVIETKINDEKKSFGPPAASDMEVRSGKQPLMLCNPFFRRPHLIHRRHYRIVFNEVANALFTVQSLSDVFVVLRDSAKKWIHGCGWVHRDISVGNLYFYNGRGLIGDWEYAKRKNSDVAHGIRSGATDFMAHEAMLGQYKYIPISHDSEDDDINLVLSKSAREKEIARRSEKVGKRKPPFFHNDLHDMESLWWIAIWELFFNGISSETKADAAPAEDQNVSREYYGLQLFPRTDDVSHRMPFFQSKENYYTQTTWMSERLSQIRGMLGRLRKALLKKYEAFEAEFPTINGKVFQGIQSTFRDVFDFCVEDSNGIKLSSFKTTGRISSSTVQDEPFEESPVNSEADLEEVMPMMEDLTLYVEDGPMHVPTLHDE